MDYTFSSERVGVVGVAECLSIQCGEVLISVQVGVLQSPAQRYIID
jgi:hypothetical protein